MSNDISTPRTDREVGIKGSYALKAINKVDANFARQLERELAAAKDEIAALKADLEQARVQLAGCGAVALANTTKSLQKTMATPEQYGYSELKAEKADMLVWLEAAKNENERLTNAVDRCGQAFAAIMWAADKCGISCLENTPLAVANGIKAKIEEQTASLTQAREALREMLEGMDGTYDIGYVSYSKEDITRWRKAIHGGEGNGE